MEHFEILRKLASGEAKRVETAATLEEARIRWNELWKMFPADYFILDYEDSLYVIPEFDSPADPGHFFVHLSDASSANGGARFISTRCGRTRFGGSSSAL